MSKLKVGIIGGGIAGIYAALILNELGHHATIFEATNRLGGRIYTHHFSPLAKGEDPFFEAGAMRIPCSSFHSCVFDLIKYLNGRNATQIEMIPYVMSHRNNMVLYDERMVYCEDQKLSIEAGLPIPWTGMSAREIILSVMEPWIQLLRTDFEHGFSEVLRYDDLSFRQYLNNVALMPHEVIDFVETIMSQTNQFDLSFHELVMQTLHFNTPGMLLHLSMSAANGTEWLTVKGGMSVIIDTAARHIDHHLSSPVTEIRERPDNKIDLVFGPIRTFDKVIIAAPPASIQNIRVRPRWSLLKETGIRSLHEGPLYKMGIHFRTRFWEKLPSPSFGGQSQTDLKMRWVVYPSNDLFSSDSGCLVLYCGMTDALRWAAMRRKARVALALDNLDDFFSKQGVDIYEHFVEAFDVAWPGKGTTSNTMLLPGQFARFHQVMKEPEGNVYFAGEHTSRHHTWIAGAIESAHETVQDMLELPSLRGLGQSLKTVKGSMPVKLGLEVAQGLVISAPNGQ